MSKGKKIALIVSMAVVLVAAAVLNVTLLATKDTTPSGEAVQTSFFATSRLNRQAYRDYEIEELNQIIAQEGDEYAAARQNATARKQQIIDAMETELLLETLLKAQGFNDVLVTVNTTQDNISVIVDKEDLDYDDAVKIYYIVASETGLSQRYVRIVAV